MAESKKAYREAVRAKYMEKVKRFLESDEDEVLRVASNEYAIPCVREDGEEDYVVLTFKMPTGSRNRDESEEDRGYDGYAMAEDYAFKCEEKRKKAEAAAIAKAKKIERDKKAREAKKAKAE